MKKIYTVFLIGLLIVGCSNPYIAPSTSKALTEKEQLEESKKQTMAMDSQTLYLKRIAEALEKVSINLPNNLPAKIGTAK